MNSADLTGARWFTSSYTNGDRACVEVAFLDGSRIAVRDTKDRGTGPAFVVGACGWTAFLGAVGRTPAC